MRWRDTTTKLIAWGLVVFVAPFLSGCLTQKLWKSDTGVDHHWAAEGSNLELFATPNRKDILVVYNEIHEKDANTKRRAFMLNANEGALQAGRRPHFVSDKKAAKLEATAETGETETKAAGRATGALKAVISEDGRYFTLVSDGKEIANYKLPAYKTGQWVRVVLTPAAATGDAIAVGSVVGLLAAYSWAQGGGTINVGR